jgi:putative ABC transport system substrate-binding protein
MQFHQLRRRDFIALFGGAPLALPLAARAQQPAMPVVGFLNSASPAAWTNLVAAFHQGLSEEGYVEHRNVGIEWRWAEGRYEQLPALAAELARRHVTVIVATGGVTSALAAKAATTVIPIVFTTGSDPVQQGLVASLNRPGGNVTGVSLFVSQMEGKRLGLLRELVPRAALIGMLLNPTNPNAERQLKDIQEAARAIGQQFHIVHASRERDFATAFATLSQMRAGALLVGADPFFNSRRDEIVGLAARHAIPAIYEQREHVVAGGLMSYGTSLSDGYRQAGVYTGRILKGEKPANLPVLQSSRFELIINLRTAKVLGIEVPPTLSAQANEVIE